MRIFLSVMLAAMMPTLAQEIGGVEPAELGAGVLPVLSEEMEIEIENETLIPGSSLMGQIALEILFSSNAEPLELNQVFEVPKPEVPKPEVSEPEVPDPKLEEAAWPTILSKKIHEAYFRSSPSGYLVDPQNLLTEQEKRDREGFFEDHAKDSSIDIYFYLFEASQQLPEQESPERVMSEHIQKLGPSLLVFYYLGMPEQTQMVISPQLERLAADEDMRSALARAIEDASNHAEVIPQIESFARQLSIRLASIEQSLGSLEVEYSTLMYPLSEKAPEVIKEPSFVEEFWNSPRVRNGLGVIGLLILAGGAGFFAKWYFDRKRIYVFPESEGMLLLQAPHAAGVGALIAYDSPSLPPSQQKDEVPDYLQKM